MGLSIDNPVIYPQNSQNILEIFRKLMPLAKLPDTQDVALGSLYSLFYYAKDTKNLPNKKGSPTRGPPNTGNTALISFSVRLPERFGFRLAPSAHN